MRVYIAGIRVAKEHEHLSITEKARYVISLLETIYADAQKKTQGDEDALIFVVMCEYALTSLRAVPHDDAKAAITMMSENVRQYRNMILIPGTCSTYEEFEDDKRKAVKCEELLRNYETVTSEPDLYKHWTIVKARNDLSRKMSIAHIGDYLFLRNCAYLITSKGVAKRLACIPFYEYKKMPNQEHESICHLGSSNPLIKVATDSGDFNIGVLACVEQHLLKLHPGTTQEEVPLFQVISSDTVTLKHEKLFAALAIQMDASAGLNGLKVVKNYNHIHADKIDDVFCFVYDTNNLKQSTEQAGLTGFNGEKYNDEELVEITKPIFAEESPRMRRLGFNRNLRHPGHGQLLPRPDMMDDQHPPENTDEQQNIKFNRK